MLGDGKKIKKRWSPEEKKRRREFCLTQTGVEKLRLLNFVLSPSNFNSFNYKPAVTCKQQSHDWEGVCVFVGQNGHELSPCILTDSGNMENSRTNVNIKLCGFWHTAGGFVGWKIFYIWVKTKLNLFETFCREVVCEQFLMDLSCQHDLGPNCMHILLMQHNTLC